MLFLNGLGDAVNGLGDAVSDIHFRVHETVLELFYRLLIEKKRPLNNSSSNEV